MERPGTELAQDMCYTFGVLSENNSLWPWNEVGQVFLGAVVGKGGGRLQEELYLGCEESDSQQRETTLS